MNDFEPVARNEDLPEGAIPRFRATPPIVPVLLASTSPRRRELLCRLRIPFQQIDPDVAESSDSGGDPVALVRENSERKARAVAVGQPGSLVIGADTVVVLNGRILGKPVDLAEARAMLSALSDRQHEVYTGITVCVIERGLHRFHCERSRVRFKPLTDKTVADYMHLVNPLDKAGAYGIQEERHRIIARIDGSFTNVMGLPLEPLLRIMEHEGLFSGPG